MSVGGIALSFCLGILSACPLAAQAPVKVRPVLFLGSAALPPLVFLEDGKPNGVVVDLARALAGRMHHPVNIRLMDWTEAQRVVQEGGADALLQINPSPERLEHFDFSQPLLTSEFSIFTTARHPGITSMDGLRGLKVGVEQKGLPTLLVRQNPEIIPEVIPDFTQGFMSLAGGALDAIIADRWVGSYVLAQNGIQGIHLAGEPVDRSQSAIAVRKGNANLLADINQALAAIRRDGSYDRVLQAWRPEEVVFETREQLRLRERLVAGIIGGLLVSLAGVVLLARVIRRIQRADKETQRLNSLLVDSQSLAHVGGWEIDLIPNTLFWTEETYRIHETSPAEFSPTVEAAIAFYAPDSVPIIQEAVRKATGEGQPFSLELELITARHRRIWVHATGRAIQVRGRTVKVLGAFQDITARKQAEAAIRESEGRLRFLYESGLFGVIFWNMNGEITDANARFLDMIGYSREDLVTGRIDWVSLTPPEFQHLDEASIAELKATGINSHPFEKEYLRKDGTRIPILIGGAMVDEARFNGMAFVLDISERQRMEARLKEKTRLLDLFIQNAPASIAMLDKDMRYIFASNRWLQDYRLDLGDIVGRSHYELFPEIPERWKEIHRRCLAGATERCDEDPFPRQDGQTDWLRWEVLPWLDNADEIGGIIITSELITDRIQAEQALRANEERMIQAQKLESLGVLVAGVAHNFNNIMAIILGTASMQEAVATDPDQLEALRIITRACERGRSLVKSLTHFGKPSMENRVPVELHTLITEVRILLGNTTRNRLEIMAEFVPEPLWILADSGSLSTVLMCLCLNSLDAMPEGGTLSFRTAVSGPDWVEVCVADTGEGMAPEVLARATEPFFTTKPVGKGTGLGLSMTHGVVKAHGGTLAITSVLGQGTQVKLRLPRIAAPEGERDPCAPPPPSRPMEVLVVDDEEDVRSLTARMLGKVGATQVQAVASGQEAIDRLRSGAVPDLVILDQHMPGMDGVQTLALLRAMLPDLPVLISSGQPDVQDLTCFQQKNVVVLAKPFTLDQMKEKLAEMGMRIQS